MNIPGPAFLATAVAAGVTVFGVFSGLQKVAPEATKEIVANWLKSADVEGGGRAMARVVTAMFEIIFGERQLSLKCIRRSLYWTVLTLPIVLVGLVLSGNRDIVDDIRLTFTGNMTIPTYLILMIFTDYISIYQTRVVVNKYKQLPVN